MDTQSHNKKQHFLSDPYNDNITKKNSVGKVARMFSELH